MIVRKLISELELEPGDEVSSATYWHDKVIVVTKRGRVFELSPDEFVR